MCFYVDNYGTNLGQRQIRARKAHECDDCRGTVTPGAVYTRTAWVFDRSVYVAVTCRDCKRIRELVYEREISEGCEPYEASCPYGDYWLGEYLSERGLSYDAARDALVWTCDECDAVIPDADMVHGSLCPRCEGEGIDEEIEKAEATR
jgi:RNase P subunit RPR2